VSFTVVTGNPLEPASVAWSHNQFRILRDGGSWAVPRSGLIFCKAGNELHLIQRMPYMKEMPITAAQLKEQQDSDFEAIKASFGAAGYAVVDKTERTVPL
jgi:hypothetical protein